MPLHVSKKPNCIHVGRPIRFSAEQSYKEELAAVYDNIMQEFRRLESLAEAT